MSIFKVAYLPEIIFLLIFGIILIMSGFGMGSLVEQNMTMDGEVTISEYKTYMTLTLPNGTEYTYTIADLSCDTVEEHPAHNNHFDCNH